MLNVNMVSHIAITKALLPKMIEQRSGQIINILSISGVLGVPYRTLYSAPKYGMDGFGKSLQSEVDQYGIRITQVYPGYVQTNISKNAKTGSGQTFGKLDDNIKKGMPVEKAVDMIIRATYLKRAEVYVCGWLYYFVPRLAFISSTLNYLILKKAFKMQKKVFDKAKKGE